MNILLRNLIYSLTILGLGLLSACSAEGVSKSMESQAIAFGKVNRINVICDKELWEGPLGDSIRFYYGAAYPILPQPEPIFDLRQITLEDIRKEPIRKELRTYLILADLSDEVSETSSFVRKDIGAQKLNEINEGNGYGTAIARNKWAKGQTLVYVYGNSFAKLRENIITSHPSIAKKINTTNEKMIDASTYFNGVNQKLGDEVFSTMQVRKRIPTDYYAAINKNNFTWLRRETDEVSINILLHKVPYTNQSQLSREGIKAIRDSLGQKYISSSEEDSYMRINDVDLPMFVKTTSINGDYAIEAKGIWDIVNDFMGGAFVSYLIYDPKQENLLFLDGFVHAPGKQKRDIMQQLEHILHSAKY